MALGIALMCNIKLPINFNSPFFSRTFSEIWLRWHVSLSYWLRDYVFMPPSRALLRRIRKSMLSVPSTARANLA